MLWLMIARGALDGPENVTITSFSVDVTSTKMVAKMCLCACVCACARARLVGKPEGGTTWKTQA